ncbi:GNAT family N-acetyltransferase [Phenylobacterium sp.]|uniref:GNAT family N-acetyltransferase n=1 Tax=Phenylobacterium sp. TaxID=1871053 RepID=UPI0011F9DDAB|nr:GNAT family N-acetyltransferase [Phenylobacterium sp.]THD61297.1 MAG: N-acetyltransferase [Phenylobacterium sp.]
MDFETLRRESEAPVTATRDQIDSTARDLSAAFVDDPLLSWFMRADAKRHAARERFFKVLLKEVAFPDGRLQRPAGGGAAAVWIPSENLGPQPLHRELRGLPMLLNASGLGRFPRLLALRSAMDAAHPMIHPHEYLWFLGVTPEAQGHGVGSRLLKAETDRLDSIRRAGFLETATPRNVPLYQRHGFRIIAEYRPGSDGPTCWGMWRDPAPAA